jgi:hypothetical protein
VTIATKTNFAKALQSPTRLNLAGLIDARLAAEASYRGLEDQLKVLRAAQPAVTRQAMDDVVDRQSRLAADLRGLAPRIKAAAMLVLIEETKPMVDALGAAAREFVERGNDANRAIGYVTTAVNDGSLGIDVARPVYAGLEQLNADVAKAIAGVNWSQARFGRDERFAALAEALLTNPMAEIVS